MEYGQHDPDINTERGRNLVLGFVQGTGSVSLLMSVSVILSYLFILWYQASMVNRISLRLIVFACLCNVIYTVMTLVSTGIIDTSTACTVIIYFIISADIGLCWCLAMIGVNLVMILIVRVNHPAKMEKYYYAFIIFIMLVGILIPMAFTLARAEMSGRSCWYHYYFVGRVTWYFKWMWYYSCLLLAIIVATICSALTIAKFLRRQDMFAGTLDMASRGDASAHTELMPTRRSMRTGQKTTVIFRKVILRCICYPLIPLICKGPGVGIESASIARKYIPLAALIIDGFLGNLIGVLVSCIYVTDPSVIAVARELSKRIKRRYVDEYCPAQPLLRKPSQRPPSTAQPVRLSLDRISSRGSRRLFSADDASTISKQSSRSNLSLYTTNSPHTSEDSDAEQTSNIPNTNGLMIQDMVAGRVSVANGILANTRAKEERGEEREKLAQIATGRRYTYPHIDIRDPHGRIAEMVSRVNTTAEITSIPGSPSLHKEERHRSLVLIMSVYQVLFPCMVQEDDRIVMMPMHRISGNRNQRRRPNMETISMNEIWALNMLQRQQTLQNGSSLRHSGVSTLSSNDNAALPQPRNESVQMVEPYRHPYLAMFMHWLLIKVFRVKPNADKQQRPVELVDVTTGRATPLQPVPKGTSSSEPTSADHMQKQEEVDEAAAAAAEDTTDESDNEDQFFKRSSIRAINFNPSSTSLDKPKVSGLLARSWSTTSSHEDRLKVSDSEDNLDPKGKKPILQRLRSFEREPPFSSLRPGKDASSRKSVKSPNSSGGSTEKFVLTVTDTGGDAEHEEIYPVHPAEPKPGGHDHHHHHHHHHLSGSRPRIFRRVSDMSPQPWSRDKSLFQHVWGRGASPSKSIKIAKQFAGRVGDTSIVKSINRHSTPPSSDDLSDSLSPPRSVPVSSASPESVHSQIYAYSLDTRPQRHRTAKRRSNSFNVPPTQVQPSMAKELMLDDFGMEHWIEPGAENPQLSEMDQEAIRRALMTTEGFAAGLARVIYIRGWDQMGTERLVVREEPWDFETLLQHV